MIGHGVSPAIGKLLMRLSRLGMLSVELAGFSVNRSPDAGGDHAAKKTEILVSSPAPAA
jgi:hypothetical protein